MKKMKKISAVILFLFLCNLSEAKEITAVKIEEGQRVSVELDEVHKGTVVLFTDNKGNILFKDSIFSSTPYETDLHMELLPEGIYFLRIESTFDIHSWKILKTTDGLELPNKIPTVGFKPQFKLEKDRLKILLSNPGAQRVKLEVFDRRRVKVGECEGENEIFKRTLDFAGMPVGNYTVKIWIGKNVYIKHIEIG